MGPNSVVMSRRGRRLQRKLTGTQESGMGKCSDAELCNGSVSIVVPRRFFLCLVGENNGVIMLEVLESKIFAMESKRSRRRNNKVNFISLKS